MKKNNSKLTKGQQLAFELWMVQKLNENNRAAFKRQMEEKYRDQQV